MKTFSLKEAAQDAAMPAEMPMQAATRMPAQVPVETPKAKIALILAVFNPTIFEEVRNSVGNATAYMHKGQNVVKKKTKKVTNPNSPEQQKQRKKFPSLVELAASFAPAIKIGLKYAKETKHTVENYFVRVNKGNVIVSEGLVMSIDYENLVLSKGTRALPDKANATIDAESRMLTLAFDEQDPEEFIAHAANDDVFYCCLVEKTLLKTKTVRLATRSELADSPQTVSIPRTWEVAAENIAVYLFCTDKSGKKTSRTFFVTLE